MCGIVGYIGEQLASDIILDALKRLEYRGYDSSGIATLDEWRVHLTRAVGKLSHLSTALQDKTASWTYRYWSYTLGNPWRGHRGKCAPPFSRG